MTFWLVRIQAEITIEVEADGESEAEKLAYERLPSDVDTIHGMTAERQAPVDNTGDYIPGTPGHLFTRENTVPVNHKGKVFKASVPPEIYEPTTGRTPSEGVILPFKPKG
jgi:hypothetical protein